MTDGTVLDASFTPLLESDAAHTRKVGLFEGLDQFGRVTPTLGVAENTTDINGNAVPFGPLSFDAPATETPTVGTTEVWDIFNLTADAHPIHLHLTQFQVLARHEISFIDANDDGVPDNVRGSATSRRAAMPSPMTWWRARRCRSRPWTRGGRIPS